MILAAMVFAHSAIAQSVKPKSEADIIELAREATLRYCGDHEPVFGGYFRTRCVFIASRTSDGWQVSGHPIYENEQGAESIVEGGDVVLYYSAAGVLLKHEGAAF
ncbi:hypothetical protein [Dyella telluris]|uniref:Uncharacterized protein n=1 Tax=Dyella telluris TaxID=2763498 RepID=A0A7G8Q640_9GAMM|nr:hypothetical protein [Dyella telluris]QNK02248.1 hypothetical protein H8F01_03555 [Dyella telluris]